MGFPSFLHVRGEPRHLPHKKSNKVVTFAAPTEQRAQHDAEPIRR